MNLDKFYSVVFGNDKVEVSAEDMQTVAGSYEFLERFAAKKLIYGINTGFGPMAQYRIDEASMRQLQINLIRSHCTGVGQILSAEETKAVMLTWLNTFLQGYSGVHTDTIELLQVLINNNITPVIYEHGSVGASGDLVQLAHLALCLVGEGEVMVDGCRRKTEDVFGQMGMALTNGTSVMTAIGLINVLRAKRLIELSVTLSSMINEVVGAFDDHFSEELNMAKRHKGQREIARTMRYILATSRCIRKRENYFYNQEIKDNFIEHKVQEYYSLRCVPQILGAIADEADNAERVLLDELNSASDNPIIDVKTGNVYHGGNFHGDYVAFEMDKLKTGITKLTMLAERQLNYLCHNKLNGILPPFVNLGVLGLNYGVQAAQFTATSTTAECQTLSMPMYVHSIPNNNDNQDIVSMGTNAALITKRVIENSFQVLAIEAVAMVQAVDYLQIADLLSVKTRQLYDRVRRVVPLFVEDNPLYGAIEELVEELKKK